jgi:hypothetical protein
MIIGRTRGIWDILHPSFPCQCVVLVLEHSPTRIRVVRARRVLGLEACHPGANLPQSPARVALSTEGSAEDLGVTGGGLRCVVIPGRGRECHCLWRPPPRLALAAGPLPVLGGCCRRPPPFKALFLEESPDSSPEVFVADGEERLPRRGWA